MKKLQAGYWNGRKCWEKVTSAIADQTNAYITDRIHSPVRVAIWRRVGQLTTEQIG